MQMKFNGLQLKREFHCGQIEMISVDHTSNWWENEPKIFRSTDPKSSLVEREECDSSLCNVEAIEKWFLTYILLLFLFLSRKRKGYYPRRVYLN